MRAPAVFLDAERDRLPLFIPVLMGTGVALYFGMRAEPPSWPAIAILAVALAALPIAWRRDAMRIGLVALAALAAGFVSAEIATCRALPVEPLPRHAVVVTGRVRAIDVLADGGRRLTVADASLDGAAPLRRVLHLRLRDDDPGTIGDGDTVSVRALLRPPSPPPYPGARDTRRDAFYAGLAGSGFALGAAIVIPGRTTTASGVAEWLQSGRDRIAARVRAALPGTDGAIAATLLVGISSAIPQADRQAFADSGLAHLLAVAGLHVGIVMGIVLGVVRTGFALSERLSLRWPTREISFVAALGAGFLYMLATGAHVPIVRSVAMATLATVAILLGRRAISMRGLAVAAVVILALWPAELVGVSFQMSFAAVAALIAGYEVARPVFARLRGNGVGRRTALHVAALALTSLIAGLASMPYAAFHFGRIQLYFVLANLVAVPLAASWIMPWGLVSLALMPFGLERWGLAPMGWGIDLVVRTARLVATTGGAVSLVPALPLAFLLLSSAGIAVLCLLRSPVRFSGLALVGIAVLIGALTRSPSLVIDEDGALVAWPNGTGPLLMEKGRGVSRYSVEAVERLWGRDGDPVRLPYDGTAGDVACTPDACRAAIDGTSVLIVRADARAADCRGIAIAVSSRFPLPPGRCEAAIRIDRRAARREGATAITIGRNGALRMVTDRERSGDRPWTEPAAPAVSSSRTPLVAAARLPVAPIDQ